MSQERKLPVKEKAYRIVVRPAARFTGLVTFLSAGGVMAGVLTAGVSSRVPLNHRIVMEIITGSSFASFVVTSGLVFGVLYSMALERIPQTVLRVSAQLLSWFAMSVSMVVILLPVIQSGQDNAGMSWQTAMLLAGLLGGISFTLLRFAWRTAKEAPKLIAKKGP